MLFENHIFMIFLWLAIFIVALVIELSTAELVAIWFAGGALVSMILACFDVNWIVQMVVFVVATIILLLITKPLINKKLLNGEKVVTNTDALIGTSILITKEVSFNNVGSGKVRDIIWTCKVEKEEVILKGEYALILRVEGNKLIVTKKEGN